MEKLDELKAKLSSFQNACSVFPKQEIDFDSHKPLGDDRDYGFNPKPDVVKNSDIQFDFHKKTDKELVVNIHKILKEEIDHDNSSENNVQNSEMSPVHTTFKQEIDDDHQTSDTGFNHPFNTSSDIKHETRHIGTHEFNTSTSWKLRLHSKLVARKISNYRSQNCQRNSSFLSCIFKESETSPKPKAVNQSDLEVQVLRQSDVAASEKQDTETQDELNGYAFSTDGNLNKRKHTGEIYYGRGVSPAACNQNKSLTGHKRKPYQCDICSSGFSTSSELNAHKSNHTRDKPYKCDICSSAFSKSSGLSAHTKTHATDKSYKCDICSTAFSTSSGLNTHKRNHTRDKPYKCDKCQTFFAFKSLLSQHKLKHTDERPYKCDNCDYAFRLKGDLNMHLKRKYTCQKVYKCDVCTEKFLSNKDLNAHKVRHSNKLYKCDICPAEYFLNSQLILHKRGHASCETKS